MLAVLVYILTALSTLVVVLTQLRLRRDTSGHFAISERLVNVHTATGAVAWIVWVLFLVSPGDSATGSELAGIVALALWWAAVVIGLLILARWLPSKGRHADAGKTDSWTKGPWLSMLAHIGLLVGVLVWTYAYLTSAV